MIFRFFCYFSKKFYAICYKAFCVAIYKEKRGKCLFFPQILVIS
uniref:Uncharacterized protein n=1 Tax=Siphoviridae sp. ctuUw41 TaxID=2826503 RepID=A0A8S5MYB2_9CAUD|nr:MAG TPA: hypothetical protein [Siphoviridae sp. ctuUw41]